MKTRKEGYYTYESMGVWSAHFFQVLLGLVQRARYNSQQNSYLVAWCDWKTNILETLVKVQHSQMNDCWMHLNDKFAPWCNFLDLRLTSRRGFPTALGPNTIDINGSLGLLPFFNGRNSIGDGDMFRIWFPRKRKATLKTGHHVARALVFCHVCCNAT